MKDPTFDTLCILRFDVLDCKDIKSQIDSALAKCPVPPDEIVIRIVRD